MSNEQELTPKSIDLTTDDRLSILRAFHHHQFRNDLHRIYPPPLVTPEAAAAAPSAWADESISMSNRLMHEWFRAMCMQDEFFCNWYVYSIDAILVWW